MFFWYAMQMIFKIFCRKYDSARRMKIATQQWLKKPVELGNFGREIENYRFKMRLQ